jgi:hypothetical protein
MVHSAAFGRHHTGNVSQYWLNRTTYFNPDMALFGALVIAAFAYSVGRNYKVVPKKKTRRSS